ncbi:hypothetical protein [Nocardia transvalensis]|uniref:hypothetical protein n=1 Tax=Nocardia transvalensis TaxID=37333 RepID=UPI0018937571|nr:hypothetical protein [Nocardia transvalensis]MBF6333661.1 hypothetical protein [Nocardia transvalensis]
MGKWPAVPAHITAEVDRSETLGPVPDPISADYLIRRAAFCLDVVVDSADFISALLDEGHTDAAREMVDYQKGYLGEFLQSLARVDVLDRQHGPAELSA